MDSYLHESAMRKGELMGIHSHIQLPNSILQHFREGTDPERKVWYLDMHSGLIQRKSAKKLGTSKGYFSDLIERFWNQQVESPISELNCRVRNFCRGEAECIWLSPEDINTVKLYIKGAAARSGIAYDEMQRNSVYGQFLPEQFMHDYLSEFAMRSTNVLDELLSVLSVTILLNRTERRFVVPRNCFYQVLIADFFIWVAPISPQCALLLYPEDRYHIADDSYFTIDSPLEVDRMNLCALKYEHTFNCDFIAASRRDELEFLQHCLQAIETVQSGTGEQYLTD